jgi:hypothetical protein
MKWKMKKKIFCSHLATDPKLGKDGQDNPKKWSKSQFDVNQFHSINNRWIYQQTKKKQSPSKLSFLYIRTHHILLIDVNWVV